MMNNEREPNDQFTAASEAGALYQNMLVEPLLATVLYYAACLVSSFKALAHLTQNCLLADDSLRVASPIALWVHSCRAIIRNPDATFEGLCKRWGS